MYENRNNKSMKRSQNIRGQDKTIFLFSGLYNVVSGKKKPYIITFRIHYIFIKMKRHLYLIQLNYGV
jgi:hypothetical protein